MLQLHQVILTFSKTQPSWPSTTPRKCPARAASKNRFCSLREFSCRRVFNWVRVGFQLFGYILMSSNFFKHPPLQPGFTTFKMPNWYPPGQWQLKNGPSVETFFQKIPTIQIQVMKFHHPAPQHPSLHQDLLGFLVYTHIYLKLSSSPPMQFSWCSVSTHHLLLNHLMNVYMNQQGLNPGLMRSYWTSPQSSHGSSGQVELSLERGRLLPMEKSLRVLNVLDSAPKERHLS